MKAISISTQQAFTLIEMMIVIAIIGILSMIAIPSYRQYLERARFTEIIASAMPYKFAIALALQQGYEMEELTTGKFGIPEAPPASNNLESIKIEKGSVIATASANLQNHTYILKPAKDGSRWSVAGSCIKANLCAT
jgi:type IV pilus assembly protein PilA